MSFEGITPPPATEPFSLAQGWERRLGDARVGQVDVRTPQMLALEQASFPILAALFQNPTAVAQSIRSYAGEAPQAAAWNQANPAFHALGQQGPQNALLNLLTGGGGGATGGAASGGGVQGQGTGLPLQAPGAGSGGGTQIPAAPNAGGGLPSQPSPQGVDPRFIQQPGQTAYELFLQQLQSGAIPPDTAPPGNPNAPAPTFQQPSYTIDLQKLMSEGAPQLGPAQSLANYLWGGLGSGQFNLGPHYNTGQTTGYGTPQEQMAQLTAMLSGTPQGQAQLIGSFGLDPNAVASGAGLPTDYFKGIQFKATGGFLDPNAFTVVGEKGPELIPPGNNQVIPLNPDPASGEIMSILGQPGAGQPPNINTVLNPPPSSGTLSVLGTIGGGGPGQPPDWGNILGNPGQFGGGGGTGGSTGGGGGTNVANPGQFPISPQQGPGTGVLGSLLASNPEMQAFNTANQFTQGLLGNNPGQGVVGALQPVFQQNLDYALGNLRNMSPSAFNSGLAFTGTDLSRTALNDFNLLASQALQQGVNQQLQGLGTLGGLASAAGQNPFQRALGAAGVGLQQRQQDLGRELGLMNLAQQQQQFMSQYGLAAQAQNYAQQVNPTLQLLLAALGQATPTGYQTVVSSGG